MDILSTISTRRTPQSQRADARQVENSAGGFTFALDDMARLRRFLTLGTDGGTYYTSAGDLTRDNAGVVLRLAQTDPAATVREIVAISTAGRAPKANPALFALAVVAATADDVGRRAALDALPLVARTGTHLFIFARYVEQFRGWGRGLRRAVARWYEEKSDRDLAYQVAKYRQREGWSHRDLLRLAHPRATSTGHAGVYDWICGREPFAVPPLLDALERVGAEAGYTPAVREAILWGASWEMLPDAVLADPATWRALLEQPGGMPQTALLRQLPRLTRLGVITKDVVRQIADPERLRKARVHPINVLVAQRTYASGRSARGEGEWTPDRRVVDALDAAFYASFGAVEPTGKRVMLALDVSGSMGGAAISGMPLTAREASAALALVTASVEDDYIIVGFTGSYGWSPSSSNTSLTPLAISPRQRLDDAIQSISNLPFGPTDCALPMLHALDKGLAIDVFVVYTDNETWAGGIHPHQALRRYREKTGIPARLVVVGMTSTGFSIADPSDALSLDVVGFDSAVPNLISDFARGL